jgi:methionine synthase II (cobalamin-independent)
MTPVLQPDGRAMLIGSQPVEDHALATRLVMAHVAEIPNWVQLPRFAQEGMVSQFATGLPGLTHGPDRTFVDTAAADFDEQMLAFFEEFLGVIEERSPWAQSRFSLDRHHAGGFFELLSALAARPDKPFAVKGQITGPVTFCTSLTDERRRAIFYNDALRDAAVKLLALKAGWQVRQLRVTGAPVIIFIDEPALAGYGSSEFISISREDIAACLQETVDMVHSLGAWAGVHVCANTDWSLLLSSELDIVNFDAFGYFDKFVLYAEPLQSFLHAGGCLAWGLVPTSPADEVAAVTLEQVWARWQAGVQALAALGIDAAVLRRQSLITPSCGTGSLPPELSLKVLAMTQALSARVRNS